MIPEERLSTTPVPAPYIWTEPRTSLLSDTEMGGVALNDGSQGLLVKLWRARYRSATGDVLLSAPDVPEFVAFKRAGITSLSLTFDQNMAPFIAFVREGGAGFWWYDPTVQGQVFEDSLIASASSVECSLDDKRPTMVGQSDIILSYVRGGSLYQRKQRERYGVERQLGDDAPALWQSGMAENMRFQWSYLP